MISGHNVFMLKALVTGSADFFYSFYEHTSIQFSILCRAVLLLTRCNICAALLLDH